MIMMIESMLYIYKYILYIILYIILYSTYIISIIFYISSCWYDGLMKVDIWALIVGDKHEQNSIVSKILVVIFTQEVIKRTGYTKFIRTV